MSHSLPQDRTIDFAVIGPAKCGSTSLFHYLTAHPDIYKPRVKELHIFNQPDFHPEEMSSYLAQWFSDADPTQLWGDVTPAYMRFRCVAARIQATVPRVKLIAILRNPVDRAYSHYRHVLRLGQESAPFAECVQKQIDAPRGTDEQRWRREIKPSDCYLADGDHYENLVPYYRCFPSSQIKVLFFEEFFSRTAKSMQDLYRWLNIDGHVDHSQFAGRHNRGGRARWPWLNTCINGMFECDRIRSLVERLVPMRNRRALAAWVRKVNVVRTSDTGPDAATREILVKRYRNDVKALEQMLGRRCPWPEFDGSCRAAA